MVKIDEEVTGWPIYALTLREILKELGAVQVGKYGFIIRNKKLLDSYPVTLQDDGMGYGIRPKYITQCDPDIYIDRESQLNVFNLFRNGYRPVNKESNS